MRNLKWVKRVKWAMAGVGLACLTAASVRAQARQPFSAQLSGIYMSVAGDPYEGTNAGPGVEAQIRWNVPGRFGGFSLGGGFQRTSHSLDRPDTDLVLTGFFLEPRFVLAGSFFGSERFAPYLAPVSRCSRSGTTPTTSMARPGVSAATSAPACSTG